MTLGHAWEFIDNWSQKRIIPRFSPAPPSFYAKIIEKLNYSKSSHSPRLLHK
jgi:hypothetical protein